MSVFSWFFMGFFILTYIASVGWSVYGQEKNLILGEDFNLSPSVLLLVGPWFIMREFFSSVVEFVIVGIRLLCSQTFRSDTLEDELSDEEEK